MTIESGNDTLNSTEKELSSFVELTKELVEKSDDYKKLVRSAFGEYSFHRQISDIIRSSDDFHDYHIFSNVFFPCEDTVSGEIFESQIDHLLICPYGVFLIDTKSWNGSTYIWSSEKLQSCFFMEEGDRLGSNGVTLLNINTSSNKRNTHNKHDIAEYYHISDIHEKARQLSNYFRKRLHSNHSVKIYIHTSLAFTISEKQRVYLDIEGESKTGLFCSEIPFCANNRVIALTFHMGFDDLNSLVKNSKKNLVYFLRDFIPDFVQQKPNKNYVDGIQTRLNSYKIMKTVECLTDVDYQGKSLYGGH